MSECVQCDHNTDGHSRAELGRVTASPLAAVGGTGRETSVALAADLLVAVVF